MIVPATQQEDGGGEALSWCSSRYLLLYLRNRKWPETGFFIHTAAKREFFLISFVSLNPKCHFKYLTLSFPSLSWTVMQYFLPALKSEGLDWQNKNTCANMSGAAEILPWPHHSGTMMASGSVHATDFILCAAFQQYVINITSGSQFKAAFYQTL